MWASTLEAMWNTEHKDAVRLLVTTVHNALGEEPKSFSSINGHAFSEHVVWVFLFFQKKKKRFIMRIPLGISRGTISPKAKPHGNSGIVAHSGLRGRGGNRVGEQGDHWGPMAGSPGHPPSRWSWQSQLSVLCNWRGSALWYLPSKQSSSSSMLISFSFFYSRVLFSSCSHHLLFFLPSITMSSFFFFLKICLLFHLFVYWLH